MRGGWERKFCPGANNSIPSEILRRTRGGRQLAAILELRTGDLRQRARLQGDRAMRAPPRRSYNGFWGPAGRLCSEEKLVRERNDSA